MSIRRVALPKISDPRGNLMIAEHGPHVPFQVERIFAIYDVPSETSRGAHAHRVQEQFLIMLSGACVVLAEDGEGRRREELVGPHQGLYVPRMVWLELERFEPGSVCLVLSSGLYDEADYVRSYDEFTVLLRAQA